MDHFTAESHALESLYLFIFFNYKKLSLTTYEKKIFNSRIWLKVNEADKPQSLHVQGLLGTMWCDFYHRWGGSCWCLSCAVASALTGGRSRAGDRQHLWQEGCLCSTENIHCWSWMQFPGTHNSKCTYIKTCCVSWYPVCSLNVMLSHWYREVNYLKWCSTIPYQTKHVEFCVYWLFSFPGLKRSAEKLGFNICL